MISNSLTGYALIGSAILAFRAITPISIIYTISRPFLPLPFSSNSRTALILSVYPLAETVFYLFAYLPLVSASQRKAIHPPLPSRKEREELVQRCTKAIDDPEAYLRKWFRDAPSEEIKRDNVKEFLTWAFFNQDGVAEAEAIGVEEGELDWCVAQTEDSLGRKFEEGRGKARPLRVTVDPVLLQHRPLIWYMIVSLVDTVAFIRLRYHGFHLYRPALGFLPKTFPLRPQMLLTRCRSPAKTLSYWHRQHTSTTRLPILFIHGIGIGIDTYISFLSELAKPNDNDNTSDEGSVGIIAIELLPISFRITDSMLRSEELCREVHAILSRHGFEKVVLVGHSYGTVSATNLLKHQEVSTLVDSVVLVDPVSILLHLPDVAYNFTYRTPKLANEHQLYYFASTDIGVAHTLGRGFFWSENILWKEDLNGRPLLVSLAGRDLIVNVKAVAKYLSDGSDKSEWSFEEYDKTRKGPARGREVWTTGARAEDESTNRGSRKVLWHEDLDHASLFDIPAARRLLARDVLKQAERHEE